MSVGYDVIIIIYTDRRTNKIKVVKLIYDSIPHALGPLV